MRVLRTVSVTILGLLILLGLATAMIGRDQMLALIFGPMEPVAIDFRTLERHGRPNQYLMCPANLCRATTDAVSPIYAVPVSQLEAAWLALVAQQPRVEQLTETPTNRQYHFIQRSRLVRYPDMITVSFIPLSETQSTLAIYSRAHIGRSDFGVNRQRITSWLDQLSAQVPLVQ